MEEGPRRAPAERAPARQRALRRAAFLALPLALALGTAQAALPDEIQVYTDDLEKPRERGVELHVNTTPSGRSAPAYPGEVTPHHGLRITPEISWGLAPSWDMGVYLPFVRSAEGADYFAGPRLRLKWLPLHPAEGASGAFAGMNWEVSFVQQRFERARRTAEIRPILGLRSETWLFAFNPILDVELAGEQKGVLTFTPAAKLARTIRRDTAIGAEYYADLGRLSHFAPQAEQSHVLYAVLDTKRINFGIGRGLSAASDRWTVKAIFSF